jgi:hypothetical protein
MSSFADLDAQDAAPYEPTEEEISRMLAASKEEYEAVDAMILRECSSQFQKVAKIVGDLLKEFDRLYGHLPFALLQARMEHLEELGRVEIVGDVWRMRYSEIRLASSGVPATA